MVIRLGGIWLRYVQVIVDINHYQVDKLFDYSVPDQLIEKVALGKRVLVPFGTRNITGFIMNISHSTKRDDLKEIYEVLDEDAIVTTDLIELTKWMAQKYSCQQVQVLKTLLPEKVKQFKKNTEKYYQLTSNSQMVNEFLNKNKTKAPVQWSIVNYLKSIQKPLPLSSIREELGQVLNSLRSLEQKKIIYSQEVIVDKNPYAQQQFEKTYSFKPNEEQLMAINEIKKALDSKEHSSYLLHGVTGSGKTEVYLQAIAHAIQLNRDAIVLVPEIALTPQTVTRFKERFGDLVAVLHSRLSPTERMDQWWKIKQGVVKVVVGARSAVFAPFQSLGLIIIDEEHETTYKQEETPRYHTKEVALYRGQLTNCVVILGTATPTLETYYEAVSTKRHQLLTLSKRAKGNLLPKVQVVDLRQELREGNRSIFSRVLQKEIMDKIAKKEQIILFLNRRGFSTFINCRECGFVVQCPHCAVSLTLHSPSDILKCHYCDYTRQNLNNCPSCGSTYIRHFGIGTQKVEEEVKKQFPYARVLRMDNDTTRKKGSHQKILDLFHQGRADILIGTQMIAKGLDFPKVTLVGVIAADLSLNIPDFRACEKTFQLVAQVAGRAGRDEIPGQVIVQTYAPENYAIRYAQQHDYQSFYAAELKHREQFNYPPFSQLLRLLVTGSQLDIVETHCGQIAEMVKKQIVALELTSHCEILGPLPAPIDKLRNQYRWHIIIKGQVTQLSAEVKKIADFYYSQVEHVKVIVDIDPINIL